MLTLPKTYNLLKFFTINYNVRLRPVPYGRIMQCRHFKKTQLTFWYFNLIENSIDLKKALILACKILFQRGVQQIRVIRSLWQFWNSMIRDLLMINSSRVLLNIQMAAIWKIFVVNMSIILWKALHVQKHAIHLALNNHVSECTYQVASSMMFM